MSKETPDEQPQINTGGGAVFEQDVRVAGDLIGRDQHIAIHTDDAETLEETLEQAGKAVVGRDQNIRIRIGALKLPRWLAATVAGILLLIVSVLLGWAIIDNQSQTQANNALATMAAPTPTPTSTPIPTLVPMTGNFRIFVADFGVRVDQTTITNSVVGQEISLWLAKQLQQLYASNADQTAELEVWHDQRQSNAGRPVGLVTDANAVEILDALRANLVIYGTLSDSDPADLELQFVHRIRPIDAEPDAQIGRQQVGVWRIRNVRDNGYLAKLNSDPCAGLRVRLLVGVTRALVQDRVDDYAGAQKILQEVEEQLRARLAELTADEQATCPIETVLAVLHYFQGREAFAQRQLSTAAEKYGAALELRPDLLPARLGLGNTHFERAQLALVANQPVTATIPLVCSENTQGYQQFLQRRIAEARQNEELPTTQAAILDELDRAIAEYQAVADAATNYFWPPIGWSADYLAANSLQLQGQAEIVDYAAQQSQGQRPTGTLAGAAEKLRLAREGFQLLLPTFRQAGQNGMVAYTLYGLGLTQEYGAVIAQLQQQPDTALNGFFAAADSFGQCAELETVADADGDTRLQGRAACYCRQRKENVEVQLATLGGGEDEPQN